MHTNQIAFLILAVLIFIFRLFRPEIKGWIGEKRVASILGSLDRTKYSVINNVVLNTHGKTSQIDHLVVSDFGVFVIETKNYKGWIVGGENAEFWTQVIYKHKNKFYNPIRQNIGHISALKHHLSEFPNLRYVSIVVFSSKAEIKVHTSKEVIHPYELLGVIAKYSEAILPEGEKEGIIQKITISNSKDSYNKSEHIRSIRQRVQKRESSIRENKCPQCGGALTVRQGRYGRFLGCSSFPKCKFIRNL